MLAEVAGELDLLAMVVGESEIERELLIEALLDAYAFEDGGRLVVDGASSLSA